MFKRYLKENLPFVRLICTCNSYNAKIFTPCVSHIQMHRCILHILNELLLTLLLNCASLRLHWNVCFLFTRCCVVMHTNKVYNVLTYISSYYYYFQRTAVVRCNSQISLVSQGEFDFRQLFTCVATYKGTIVAVRKVRKKHVELTRNIKKELKIVCLPY